MQKIQHMHKEIRNNEIITGGSKQRFIQKTI